VDAGSALSADSMHPSEEGIVAVNRLVINESSDDTPQFGLGKVYDMETATEPAVETAIEHEPIVVNEPVKWTKSVSIENDDPEASDIQFMLMFLSLH